MSNRLDSMEAKEAGKANVVKTRLDGLVGVFKTLVQQHSSVSALLRRMQDRPEKKAELWPEIRRELLSHERGEMRAVYPVLREHALLRGLAGHHAQEASEIERLIGEIDAAQPEAGRRLIDQLVDAVRRHIEMEEKEIFPKAQKAIGEQGARELDAKFFAAKKSATTV